VEAYRYLADAYDLMMEDVDYNAWTAYLHGLLARNGARHLFETACGTGEITCRLFDLGYDIIAADASETMLRVAAEKARKSGRTIRFVQQDLRRIETARPMDAVLCVCDGVNYVDAEGTKRFARSAYAALKSGGLLLFDISTRCKLQSMDNQVYFDDAEDAACIWMNRYDEKTETLQMDVTLFIRQGELFERHSERHVQHAHRVDALTETLREAGFSGVDVYEAFTEDPVTAQTQRAQFVCVR
jgi:ubiquinone/menaquinone biosynthesis C-methylase UbiE